MPAEKNIRSVRMERKLVYKSVRGILNGSRITTDILKYSAIIQRWKYQPKNVSSF